MRVLALMVWVGSIMIGGAPAVAAGGAEAEGHIKTGVELRRRGDDQAALVEFKKAYALDRTPRAAAQLALCEQSLALWVNAEGHILEALGHKDDPWIGKNWNALEAAMATIRKHTARLEVVGSPEGAEVSVAGQSLGHLPMSGPALVNAGPLDLEVTARGYQRVQRALTLASDGYQSVLVRLEPVAPSAVATPTPLPRASEPAPPGAAPADTVTLAASAPETDERPSPIYQRAWFWVAIGAVVAGGVVGAVFATRGTSYPSGEARTLP